MFHCERCGSSFNASIASSAATCPRCKLREGKDEPLYFRLFEPSALRVSGLDPRRGSGSPSPHTGGAAPAASS